MKVLIVDDDPQILDAVAVGIELQWQDATAIVAADGNAGLRAFDEHDPDVVLLDLMLPDMSGLDVLREIRRVADVPVIVLTARGDEASQVRALERGADDYIVKPFSQLVLTARIRAVMRRAELPPPTRALPDFVAGDVAINFQNQQVTVRGVPVKFTPLEYRLLYHLARNAGRLMTHDALVDRVWGDSYGHTTDHLKAFVSRIRAKIERGGDHQYIENERGIGYRFVRPTSSEPVGAGV